MRLPQWPATFNKYVTNPVARLFAARVPPLLIIHEGRASGERFKMPVMCWRHGSLIIIPLTYGPGVDWLENLHAAGGGVIERAGVPSRVGAPRVVDREETLAAPPGSISTVLKVIRPEGFIEVEVLDDHRSQVDPEVKWVGRTT